MKLLKLSWTSWQAIIFLLLIAFLWWDSMPVLGPDGRIVCVIEFFVVNDDATVGNTVDVQGLMYSADGFTVRSEELLSQVHIMGKRDSHSVLKSIVDCFPSLKGTLTWRWRIRIAQGQSLTLSLTPEQWKILHEAKNEGYLFEAGLQQW